MEITLEVLYQGQQKIENELYGLKQEVDGLKQAVGGLKQEVAKIKQDMIKQEIINSSLKTTQWAVGLFIGTIITLTSVIGVYTALITFAIQ